MGGRTIPGKTATGAMPVLTREDVAGALSTGIPLWLTQAAFHFCKQEQVADNIGPVAAPSRRGPSLARRTYQAGSVFQKGRNKKKWDNKAPAYGRFWKYVHGVRRRCYIRLGVCRTRSIAEHRCAEEIERQGINSSEHFVRSTSALTFRQQAAEWLKSLANRKRKPVERTTIDNYRHALEKWIYPCLAGTYLADVNNITLKRFVDKMALSLSAATVRDYAYIVKAVVASALDENGEPRFPRKWNSKFIDAPLVKDQYQPTSDCAGISDIVFYALGQYRMLYALLAGCGPMRAGEALGLEIGKHISADFRTLHIVQKAKRGLIQPFLKTKNGERDIDLCTPLAEMLREFVGDRKSGLLFQTSTGKQLLQANTLQDSLHPILNYMAHEYGGFNIFRRFRLTHLETDDCPEVLKHFWAGHAPKHVSERYIKLTRDRDYRLKWAEKIGLGFEPPGTANLGRMGRLLQFRKAM